MAQRNATGKGAKNPFSRGKLRRSLIINSKVSPKQRERRQNANKRQDDQIRVRFEHNPKVRTIIYAKKKSKQDTSSYNKEAFIEHVVDFYSGIDKDLVSLGVDALADFFKRKHTDLAVCGDMYDRQLLRDFVLLRIKEQAMGFISDE